MLPGFLLDGFVWNWFVFGRMKLVPGPEHEPMRKEGIHHINVSKAIKEEREMLDVCPEEGHGKKNHMGQAGIGTGRRKKKKSVPQWEPIQCNLRF